MMLEIKSPLLRLACVVGALVTLTLPGCSSGEREYMTVPLAKVTGKVLDNGEPVVRAKVAFHPVLPSTDPPLIPSAMTDEQGQFQLTTYVQSDGAPPGEYRVTLSCPVLPSPKAAGIQLPVDKYKGRFSNPEKSKWTVTVNEGENSLDPFDVSSGK